MDPMIDLVRDRTADLRRTAEAARRERQQREQREQYLRERAVAAKDPCEAPCISAGTRQPA